jgi:ubiquinone/menaquinone biosynthesis C-methylase UbiE
MPLALPPPASFPVSSRVCIIPRQGRSRPWARNAINVRADLLELRRGNASQLPYAADSFNAVFSTNVAQFWESPADVAIEIRRGLKPGALIALAVQPRNKGANEETCNRIAQTLRTVLISVGFSSTTEHRKLMKQFSTVCVLARK